MTLGELIDEAIEATIDKLTEGTMDANVIRGVSFDLKQALPALWAAEVYTVEDEFGGGGSFPVSFDVAPDIGRIYVEPGDRVVVIRKTEE